MRCPACGKENNQGARFCAFCGFVLDDEPRTLQPGQSMDGGTYRIIRPLGKGGMGAVYLAANTKAFDRQCVIKEVIEYYDASDPVERQKAIQRFEIEARMLAALKHSGIPDIYAYFSEGGRNYLVMEYIEGPNLAQGLTHDKEGQIVQGQPLKVEEVIRYTIQVCKVLDYLQGRQPPVIHNDIKPANIILDQNSGRTVLVDFGTAKTRYARQAAGQPGRQQSSVYGTVGYAAPELYDGSAEPRSDVYALAATAYHLLTDDDPRSHPFQFPKMDAIPEPLRKVLGEALAAKVEERPSAVQFGERLEGLLQDKEAPLPPLTFPKGDKAATREEMIALSVKHWDYASDILYDGSMTRWLRDAVHDPVAARMAENAVKRHADDPNAGLESFIRSMDPQAMPLPQLKVLTGRLAYERAVGRDDSQQIEIANTGGGYLYGTVTSSAEWLDVKGRPACAPGQTQSLPVVVRTGDLVPGQVYRARVDIQASGAQSATIPVEVKVPPPIVDISPTRIELGVLSSKELFTERASFVVQNRGEIRAECQIEGNPLWLVLAPSRFTCMPGQKQVVELVGRADKLPAQEQERSATLHVQVKGIRPRQVQVVVKSRADKKSRLASFLMIGCATLILLGAIIWFLVTVLPSL